MKEAAPAHTGIRSGVPAIADDEPWPREVLDAVTEALADALVADFKGEFHPMVKSPSGIGHEPAMVSEEKRLTNALKKTPEKRCTLAPG